MLCQGIDPLLVRVDQCVKFCLHTLNYGVAEKRLQNLRAGYAREGINLAHCSQCKIKDATVATPMAKICDKRTDSEGAKNES
jgi:hypothetical protein